MTSNDGRDERKRPPSVPRRMPASIPPKSAPERREQSPEPRQPAPKRQRPQPAPLLSEPARPKRQWHRLRRAFLSLVVILALALGAFWIWVELRIDHVEALSGAAATPGQTYLIVGSDSRDGWIADGTEGARTDTIIILHKPEQGPTALISIPRDSYVEIPGHSRNKINAAYAFGGPTLLVQTVELLTGLTIDHYLEIGFVGVTDVVDALGGVELCLDQDVSDRRSRLEWEAGCHLADGDTALAFSRMRYADPIGDIGRTARQQQLVSAVVREASSPETLRNPVTVVKVTNAGLNSLRVSADTRAVHLARAALVFKSAQSDEAVTGTPPLVSINHTVSGVGSTVLLDADAGPEFWRTIANGGYAPGTEVGGF